ncbi:MAG TPA: imidazolonepropionase, partial [Longimicrobiales bacterium]|nr:imidazolonepropionase [Longimicrobiales bacterium]
PMGPWDRLWIDAHLATMVPSEIPYGTLRDGALAVRDGRIAWVGPRDALPRAPHELADEVRSAAGGWITPGLVDCHTHLVFAGDRSEEFERRLRGATYRDIAEGGGGILATVRATRAASEDELVDGGARRLRRLVAEGVTTVEVKSGYGLDTRSELTMLRAARRLAREGGVEVRTTLLAAHAVPPEFAGRRREYVDLIVEEMIPAAQEEALADHVDAFLEDIAFGPGEVARVFEAAASLGLPVRLHADQLSDGGGAALAARHGALSADHLEHASEEGVAAMAEAGTVAVLLPGAWLTLGETQRPPVAALRRHEVPVAVASDANPGSSPLLSLLLAMNLGCTLFGLTPEEALAGVTRNAARALGLDGDRGTLEVGRRADLAVWDVARPAELAYWMGANLLREAVKDGTVRPGSSAAGPA